MTELTEITIRNPLGSPAAARAYAVADGAAIINAVLADPGERCGEWTPSGDETVGAFQERAPAASARAKFLVWNLP